MTEDLFGLELLFANVQGNLQKKEDVLLVLIHYKLLRRGFKCVGDGEEKTAEIKTSSELLPNGWNSKKEFTLSYIRESDKCTLISQHNDDVILFNIVMSESVQAFSVVFKYNEIVSSLTGSISVAIPTYKDVMKTIDEQLLAAFNKIQTSNNETQTTESTANKGSIIVPELNKRPCTIDFPSNFSDVREIGRRDLDPLAAMGGSGMLFDPLREHRNVLREEMRSSGLAQPLPRGSVPPRARFDPFGPPEPFSGRRNFPPDMDDMFS